MLRKTSIEEGRDWDRLIPYFLFAYREVPQASTGFSPFELLYGRSVRGPLDILKESWKAAKRSDESVVSHVLSIREKMEKMSELVCQNLKGAQKAQKRWYDKNASDREFQPADQVLILLPTSSNKLLAQSQGPFQIVKRIGKVNYLIDMHERRKRRRIFHIIMLCKWNVPSSTSYWIEDLTEDDAQDDVPMWNEDGGEGQPKVGEELGSEERSELSRLLEEYGDVFWNKPGRTTLAEHDVDTGLVRPVKLPPYRLPQEYQDQVKQELDEMLEMGIIEHSSSEWSAPIVLGKKKDKSLRLYAWIIDV